MVHEGLVLLAARHAGISRRRLIERRRWRRRWRLIGRRCWCWRFISRRCWRWRRNLSRINRRRLIEILKLDYTWLLNGAPAPGDKDCMYTPARFYSQRAALMLAKAASPSQLKLPVTCSMKLTTAHLHLRPFM